MFEGLLSLAVLGLAFEWTQGSEPGPWYAQAPAAEAAPADRWAFGIRSADDPLFRSDAWHLPLDAGPADPVTVCSVAVAELWAGTAADPAAARAGGEAVCALPLPGRWTSPPHATGDPTDALAAAVPAVRPTARTASVSRTSPHSAAAALISTSQPADWHAGPSRPADLIASIGEDDR